MDFKKLAEQYKSELLDSVLPFWLDHSQDHDMEAIILACAKMEVCLIPISLFGCKGVRYGCFPCFIIKWRSVRNGWIVPFREENS